MRKPVIRNFSSKNCPDEIFGILEVTTNNNVCKCNWTKTRNTNNSQYSSNIRNNILDSISFQKGCANIAGAIFIILESPHIDEYHNSGNPKGPAMGKTGQKIEKCFNKIIENAINKKTLVLGNGSFLVCLLNAIQYQCSMGISPINHYVKEMNFIRYYPKNDLITRINKLNKKSGNNLKMIVNSCTEGVIVPLHELVNYVLVQHFNSSSIIIKNTCHPSSPQYKNATLK